MANPKHVEKLKEGVEAWNKWREDYPGVEPDLKGAAIPPLQICAEINKELLAWELQESTLDNPQTALNAKNNYIGYNFKAADLRRADFSGLNLQGAIFQEAQLQKAKFQAADLTEANFCGAKVSGIEFDNKMKCRGIEVTGCTGSQRFVRHVMDLDYIEETREKHPSKYMWWKIVSDFGRSWPRLASWCCVILYVFWAILDILKVEHPLVTSIMAFTSFGFVDSRMHTTAELVLICTEAVLGYIMFGALISLIASQMGRRS